MLFLLRWEQDQLIELDPFVERFGTPATRQAGGSARWRWQHLAALHSVERGHLDQARAIVDRIAGHGLRAIPRDTLWFGDMGMLAYVFARLDDRERAAELYELLEPFRGLVATWPTLPLPVCPVAYALGLLATTLARWDDAERHFAAALALSERIGSPPWAAHACHAWADMLARRAALGDSERALDLNDQALIAAEQIGMTRLARQALALKVRLQGIPRA